MNDVNLKRVLIVDDDRFMRMTIKAIVSGAGRFVVAEAVDGTDALAKVAEFRPDLVLCDVGMAPMGGIAFVEALRTQADEAQRGIPVIMLTADATEATIVTAAKFQISGYLLKPLSSQRVANLLRTIFNPQDATYRAY